MSQYKKLQKQLQDNIENVLEFGGQLHATARTGADVFVSESEDGGLTVTYHKGEMPPYLTEHYENSWECAGEMMKVAMPENWQYLPMDDEE